MEGTNNDNRRAHADMQAHNHRGCIEEGQSETLSCFYQPTLAKLRNSRALLLLRGSLMGSGAELFSGVALIALVVAKQHSTAEGERETKNTNSRRKIE